MDRPDIEGALARAEKARQPVVFDASKVAHEDIAAAQSAPAQDFILVPPDPWGDLAALARWALEVEGQVEGYRAVVLGLERDLHTLQAAVEAVEGECRSKAKIWDAIIGHDTEEAHDWLVVADALAAAREGKEPGNAKESESLP